MSTMVRPQWLRCSTFITPPPLCLDDLFLEIIATGIDGDGAEVCEPQNEEEDVEDYRFFAGGWAGIEGRKMEDQLRAIAEKGDQDADGGHGKVAHNRCVVEAGHDGEDDICAPEERTRVVGDLIASPLRYRGSGGSLR